jgi:hypothetical protein
LASIWDWRQASIVRNLGNYSFVAIIWSGKPKAAES